MKPTNARTRLRMRSPGWSARPRGRHYRIAVSVNSRKIGVGFWSWLSLTACRTANSPRAGVFPWAPLNPGSGAAWAVCGSVWRHERRHRTRSAGRRIRLFGSLEGDERAEAERLFAGDLSFARAVAEWEQRLTPLTAHEEAVTPPSDLWRRIESSVSPTAEILPFTRRVRFPGSDDSGSRGPRRLARGVHHPASAGGAAHRTVGATLRRRAGADGDRRCRWHIAAPPHRSDHRAGRQGPGVVVSGTRRNTASLARCAAAHRSPTGPQLAPNSQLLVSLEPKGGSAKRDNPTGPVLEVVGSPRLKRRTANRQFCWLDACRSGKQDISLITPGEASHGRPYGNCRRHRTDGPTAPVSRRYAPPTRHSTGGIGRPGSTKPPPSDIRLIPRHRHPCRSLGCGDRFHQRRHSKIPRRRHRRVGQGMGTRHLWPRGRR